MTALSERTFCRRDGWRSQVGFPSIITWLQSPFLYTQGNRTWSGTGPKGMWWGGQGWVGMALSSIGLDRIGSHVIKKQSVTRSKGLATLPLNFELWKKPATKMLFHCAIMDHKVPLSNWKYSLAGYKSHQLKNIYCLENIPETAS